MPKRLLVFFILFFSAHHSFGQTAEPKSPLGDIRDIAPRFEWQRVPQALGYEVWVRDLTEKKELIRDHRSVRASTYIFTVLFEPGHRYRWWVRPILARGQFGPWSKMDARFHVEDIDRVPGPRVLGPIDGATVGRFPIFSWQPGQLDQFEIQVKDLTEGSDPVTLVAGVSGNTYRTQQPLNIGHNYRWWIRGKGRWDIFSQWTDAGRFRVDRHQPQPEGVSLENAGRFTFVGSNGIDLRLEAGNQVIAAGVGADSSFGWWVIHGARSEIDIVSPNRRSDRLRSCRQNEVVVGVGNASRSHLDAAGPYFNLVCASLKQGYVLGQNQSFSLVWREGNEKRCPDHKVLTSWSLNEQTRVAHFTCASVLRR